MPSQSAALWCPGVRRLSAKEALRLAEGDAILPAWENYPKEIVQSTPETDAIMDKFSYEIKDNDEFDKMSNEINHEISKYGIPTKDILQCILDEIKERTGIEWELGCDTNSYTKQWWEANIPLKYNGKEYLLTWANCD